MIDILKIACASNPPNYLSHAEGPGSSRSITPSNTSYSKIFMIVEFVVVLKGGRARLIVCLKVLLM